MSSVLKVIELKEKILNNEKVKNSILERHKCAINKEGIIIEKVSGSLHDAVIMFSSTIFMLTGFTFYLYDLDFLAVPCWIASIFSGFYSIHQGVKSGKSHSLIHDDFLDISEIVSKEEIKTINDFYENQFYQKETNQNKTYKLNLDDLLGPINLENNPEEAKYLNKQKLDVYLDSVYTNKKSLPSKENT